jgi:DHA1 family multidrug resistance protein-like MFS transporter
VVAELTREIETVVAARPEEATERATLAALYRAIFVVSSPGGIFLVFLPLYAQALGASATEIGVLFAICALVPVLARPLVGRGADRYGRRPFVLAGLGCFVLAWGLYASSARVGLLFAARVAEGSASALLLIPAYAILADLVPADGRGAAVGRLQGMINFGAFIGGGVGFALLFGAQLLGRGIVTGWRVAFCLYALATIVVLLLARRRVSEPPRRVTDDAAALPVVGTTRGSLRALVPLLVICLGTATANGVTQPILTLYLKDRFPDNLALILAAFMPAAIVYGLAPAPLGRLSDRIGRRRVMASGLAAAGVVAAIFPSLPNILLLGVLWTLEAVCVSAAVPAEGALVADLTGGARRGAAYGLYSFAVGTGATLGPILGGWVYDHIGHPAPFYTNAILLPLSALLVVLLPIEARRPWHTPVLGSGMTGTPGSKEVRG